MNRMRIKNEYLMYAEIHMHIQYSQLLAGIYFTFEIIILYLVHRRRCSHRIAPAQYRFRRPSHSRLVSLIDLLHFAVGCLYEQMLTLLAHSHYFRLPKNMR